jgi:hypothetical protein
VGIAWVSQAHLPRRIAGLIALISLDQPRSVVAAGAYLRIKARASQGSAQEASRRRCDRARGWAWASTSIAVGAGKRSSGGASLLRGIEAFCAAVGAERWRRRLFLNAVDV